MRIYKTKEFFRKILPVFMFQRLHLIHMRCLFICKKCLFFPYYIKYVILRLLKDEDIGNDEIISVIDGGLGSQMSQFVQGQEIQRITGVQVSYDLSWYEKDGKDSSGKENRLFMLEKIFPNVQIKRASKKKTGIYKYVFNMEKYNKQKTGTIMQNLDDFLIKPPMYLGGYWQSEKYANYDMENLRKLYTFKLSLDDSNKVMLGNILSEKCGIAVQIRLGDYTGSAFDVITPEYFFSAIDYMNRIILDDKHFFVFSDDVQNAMLMMGGEGGIADHCHKLTYVNINDNDHGAYDIYLMIHCHHFIISNSGFGFWAALLSNRSKDKLVIQPCRWFRTDTNIKPLYPGWMVMEC